MIVGILQCDDVLEQFQDQFGNYPEMIEKLLRPVMPAGTSFVTYQAHRGQLPVEIDECDAYITTGSRHGVNDGLDWADTLAEFILKLYAAEKKLVGLCFGHQLMAKALGGRIDLVGWGIGISYNSIVKTKQWMQPEVKDLNIVVSHKEQVVELPAEAEVLASSDFCPNYMLQMGPSFLSIQGHPEFSCGYSKALSTHRQALIGEAHVRDAISRLSDRVDAGVMAQWIANFFLKAH